MKILVLNCGSSSVKYRLFAIGVTEETLVGGMVERIGLHNARHIFKLADGNRIIRQDISIENHHQAIGLVLETLVHSDNCVLTSVTDIDAVGHRVVHGGKQFSGSVPIDKTVVQALYDNVDLAPLHNPHNIAGIEAVTSLMPGVAQVAVFDTAFHQTIPARAHHYALPYELCEKHRIRRYGFHGTSHRFVVQEAARYMGRPVEELRIISCHLGNGASVSAIKYGQSIDTSMGFTPLEGLVMGTRSGDMDPAVVLFLMDKLGLSTSEANELLNKKSGVLGVSGHTSDMREIEEAVYSDLGGRILNTGHPHHRRARLALEMYIYRLKKYIGAYAAAMGGLDALVFTGGVGEHSKVIPEDACSELEFLGIELGVRIDLGRGWYELSKTESQVRVLVIPTNEELMIARDTYQVAGGKR
jgi:acetate kinase